MSARTLRPFPCLPIALGLALLGSACNRGPTQPESIPPSNDQDGAPILAASDDDEADDADETCRDWSDLDVAQLPALPDTPYTATFETVWRTVLEKHYDPTLSCLDWPAIRQEYGAQLADAGDDAAAYGLMTQMLGRLGQSHLAVVPPQASVEGEPRSGVQRGDGRVPIEVRVIGGEAIVVDPAAYGRRSGIPGGATLLAVDDHEVAPVLSELSEHHEREVETTFAMRRIVSGWLSCPIGTTKSLRYQPFGAAKPKTRKVKCRKVEVERVSFGNLENIPAFVEHRMIPGTKVGYVAFNIWMLPLMEKIEAAVTELRGKGMEALVIDLRGNPGGVGAMAVPLGRLLLAEDADLGSMHMRTGKQTFKVSAGKDPFTGPVALLIDEGTASTSEIFGQALKDLGRATVFGAVPSQGAALPSLIEELPGGGILQYVVADYQSPGGTAVEGKGVLPDTVVLETAEDFAKGRDPVLEAAVSGLTSND